MACRRAGSDLYGYNGWVDPWGTYILISKFRTVLFGPVFMEAPAVAKRRLLELPHTEMREWMIDKELPHVNLPAEMDLDGQPAISLIRPDYVKEVILKSFSHFDDNGMPVLKDDEEGNIMVITGADSEIATREWWRAMKDPRAYGSKPLKPANIPYNEEAFTIPGSISAAQFDYGGEGVSYHCRSSKSCSQILKTAYRVTDHVKFDGIEKCSLSIPGTGGWQEWQTISQGRITLDSGLQVMRLVCVSGRFNLKHIEFITIS